MLTEKLWDFYWLVDCCKLYSTIATAWIESFMHKQSKLWQCFFHHPSSFVSIKLIIVFKMHEMRSALSTNLLLGALYPDLWILSASKPREIGRILGGKISNRPLKSNHKTVHILNQKVYPEVSKDLFTF